MKDGEEKTWEDGKERELRKNLSEDEHRGRKRGKKRGRKGGKFYTVWLVTKQPLGVTFLRGMLVEEECAQKGRMGVEGINTRTPLESRVEVSDNTLPREESCKVNSKLSGGRDKLATRLRHSLRIGEGCLCRVQLLN
ncbi:hypothetical protein E2C01_099175 [Portunus trituberculatus]|uniref:Uncharacterized protein n=1 Tax=Portunus trituberculatus TaxID=210409 RepID=A0A5B7KA58_PORTR|nr:hypothetical protein [Portunus trituberculatus]